MRALILLIAAAGLAGAQTAAPAKRAVEPPPLDYRTLKFGTLPEVKIPEIPTVTLPNGIRLYLLENRELPLVSGFALVRTGNLFDPTDKVGLATLTGMVMRTGGTGKRTGEQLDVELENIAASVESSIGESSGRVGFSCLKDNVDQVLGIFKDVLTSPEFRQDKIDLAKTQIRGGIARRNDEAGDIASREFTSLIYGKNTPYGWDIEYEHIDRIQREDLLGFYRRYFFPANIMLAVQGDFSAPEMRAKLEKLFADWTVQQPKAPEFPPVKTSPAPGVYLGVKNDVTQTFFRMGHLGGLLNDKDFPALSVMSDILGGGFGSRLFTNVRTKLGYVYSIGGGWGAEYDHPGIFSIGGSTQSARTVDAIQAAKAEIDRIRTAEVTAKELDSARQTVLNGFVFNFDHPSKTLGRIVTYDYYGYPRDFIYQYQKAVAATTQADVLRVAKQHLKPELLTVVAVGKPADFGKPLTELGSVKELDLTIPEPKAAPKAAADAGSLGQGKLLLAKAQQAVGGADRLAALKDVVMEQKASVETPQGPLEATQKTAWRATGEVRVEQEYPFGTVIIYYDGKDSGWMQTPEGNMPMPPPLARQMASDMFRNLPTLLLSDRSADRTVNATGPNRLEISDKQGHSVVMELDEKGLPVRQTYTYSFMGAAPAPTTATLSDYREAGGVLHPGRIVIEQNGNKIIEASVTNVRVNTGVSVADMSKK